MDDFTVTSLQESKNEWCARLVNILTPLLIDGCNSIFEESYKLCKENDELDKYLMTFQNLITRVPKWNENIIKEECNRIIEKSGCTYLEDLISCVHIIQLKVLTCIRVGQNQKKVDINIPKLENFIHSAYIHVARKLYTNVYLYEQNVSSLQKQKYKRELEVIIQECILTAIRDSLPIEEILRNYMDETTEEDVIETIEEEKIAVEDDKLHDKPDDKISNETSENNTENKTTDNENTNDNLEIKTESISDTNKLNDDTNNDDTNNDDDNNKTSISFNDTDTVLNNNDDIENVVAPKNIEYLTNKKLEQISYNDDDEEKESIKISSENVKLDNLDIYDVSSPPLSVKDKENLLEDVIEILN